MGIVDIDYKVPSWNAAYRTGGRHMYKTDEAKAYQEAMGYAYKGDFHSGDVDVFIEFYRNPMLDVDNVCKLTLDSLEGIAYKRDRQVASVMVERHYCAKGEDRIYVSVNPK